jgi:hypothetical protein
MCDKVPNNTQYIRILEDKKSKINGDPYDNEDHCVLRTDELLDQVPNHEQDHVRREIGAWLSLITQKRGAFIFLIRPY